MLQYFGEYSAPNGDSGMAIQSKVLSISDSEGGGVPCPNCRHTFPPLPKTASAFFEAGTVDCRHCSQRVNLWEAALDWMRTSGASSVTLGSFGAEHTSFSFYLKPNETKELILTDHGIPSAAVLLSIVFTPQGADCFPNVVHANSVPARALNTKMMVFGRPFLSGTAGAPIIAAITWVPPSEGSVSWVYLAEAFDAFAARRHWNVILPAYVSFELSLMNLLRPILERVASKNRVSNFMNDGLKSSDALNVLLPLLCDFYGLRPLPDPIRGELNHLRDLRNDFVHDGLERESVTEETTGRLLCAAIFGLEYLRYVKVRFDRHGSTLGNAPS